MTKRDDIFLSRWLNNQLSEDELKQFKASEDYSLYVKIIQGAEKLQAPTYDLNASFEQLKNARDQKPNLSKKWRGYSIAASIILLIGCLSYFSFFNETTYASGYGEQLTFNLPDGSEVILNSKSTITFHKFNWNDNRQLTLDGEAFFDVEKGNTFTVNTNLGNVTVLGTEFNVNATKAYFNVFCYEGKVKVDDFANSSSHILTPHLGYQNSKHQKALNFSEEIDSPMWLQHQSVFKSTPIKHVFETLEKHYNLKFTYVSFDDTILFTGVFPNNNQNIALETVLKSLNLTYTVDGNRVIIED